MKVKVRSRIVKGNGTSRRWWARRRGTRLALRVSLAAIVGTVVGVAPANATVTPEPPTVHIGPPTENEVFAPGEPITLFIECREAASGPPVECEETVPGFGTFHSGGTLNVTYGGGLSPGTYHTSVLARAENGLTASETVEFFVSQPLGPGVNSCNGAYSGSGGSVVVPAGASCILEPGTKVSGNVQSQGAGSTLIDEGALISGSVQMEKGKALEVSDGGAIGGNLIVSQLTGKPASGDNKVCDTHIGGNVQVLHNSASSPIDLGDLGSCTGEAALTVGGSLLAQGNGAALTISGNTIGSFLEVVENTAMVTVKENTTTHGRIAVEHNAGGTLTSNSSGEACYLSGDKPTVTGTSNTAKAGDPNTCNRSA